MNTQQKLEALRTLFAEIDGIILPMSDCFLSEYVPQHENRIFWLSGFTGSTATIVVLKEKAAFFTDGRYMLQAEKELDANCFELFNIADMNAQQWLNKEGKITLGIDAKRISISEYEKYKKVTPVKLLNKNLVDEIWKNGRDFIPSKPWPYAAEFSGETSDSKISRVSTEVEKQGADALFIGSAENVNWLFNIRGSDCEATPVFNSFAILLANKKTKIFTHEGEYKFSQMEKEFLELKDKRVLVDKTVTTAYVQELLLAAKAEIIFANDLCTKMRAIKNPTELKSIREIHKRDGSALSAALANINEALDEHNVSEILLRERKTQQGFLYPSFPTIAGMNANGAIVHYRAKAETAAKIEDGILLIDSGGQYLGGTTDVTRTVAIGTPTIEQKQFFTRVLKGHIALANTQFPKGTTGSQLDVLARQFLWQANADYDHGTGHGVGNCLGVHEGPQRISKRYSDAELEPGMILSNEPGYYRKGEFGIRIENLVVVVEKTDGFLGFETITLAPIDRKLIDSTMLSTSEREWVDKYHKEVFEVLELRVSADIASWLKTACAPLNQDERESYD